MKHGTFWSDRLADKIGQGHPRLWTALKDWSWGIALGTSYRRRLRNVWVRLVRT